MLNTLYVEIEGYVGNHPEVTTKSNGETFVKINVATNHKRVKDGQESEVTFWHVIYFNGPLAEFAIKGLRKGIAIQVKGRGDFEQYQDKKGIHHTRLRVYAEKLRLLAQSEAKNRSASSG